MKFKITKENGKMPFWLIFTFKLIIVENYLHKKRDGHKTVSFHR